ncbi:GNAT family N-acetyltransferase [Rapidithrix thailandica]|uniref:GNAT family N-acetyltransferase n=1 Tax=Rapidithrix thailandica TaxID=413964 RepID=A0AAW9S291_9BACT
MNKLKYSRLDSERFGLVIHRAKLDEIDAKEIVEQIIEHKIDTAILRIPTQQLSFVHKLDKLALPNRITDTLAYYHFDLEKYEKKELINQDLEFKVATPNDHEIINQIVRETFGQYVNHYRMNPIFDNEAVTEGYMDWMRSYAEGNEDRVCWLVYQAGELVGFGTFNFQIEEKVKGILYGVKPNKRGKGIFKDIMTYAKNYAKDRGRSYMRATTQIENIHVQKAWTKEGFELHHTENTIHINALLSKSVFDTFTVPLVLKQEEASSKKVSNRYILKQINYHFDFSQNILTQNHRFVNLKQMAFEKPYTLHFSFPIGSTGLLQVKDEEGNTYMLVYFDLKHFLA